MHLTACAQQYPVILQAPVQRHMAHAAAESGMRSTAIHDNTTRQTYFPDTTGEQAERFALLRQIDRHATDIFGSTTNWLGRANPPAFSGRTPLEHMLNNGRRGIDDVLRFLELQAFKASL
jgi:uncharacterized protein (DUF2384 family)